MKPLNAHQVVMLPLDTCVLARPAEDEPLFPGTDRMWYLSFVEPWDDFKHITKKFLKNEVIKSAFDEIKDHPIVPPRVSSLKPTGDQSCAEILKDFFQREALEIVQVICNKLLKTETTIDYDIPEKVEIGKPKDEDIGNQDCPWMPDYVVRATTGKDVETRMIGHVEYLGGRPMALSWAIQEQAKNSWGSLRCVLGDITQWMLMDGIRYAFLTSCDEVMFLKFEIFDRAEEEDFITIDEPRDMHLSGTVKEARLYYSDPIKHTDVLDETKDTIPVRLALLYLLYTSIGEDWQLPSDIGSALNYAKSRKAGQRWVPRPPRFW